MDNKLINLYLEKTKHGFNRSQERDNIQVKIE